MKYLIYIKNVSLISMLISFNFFAQYSNTALTTTSNIFESETAIAVDPLNENNILVGWNDCVSIPCVPGYAFSSNNGITWTRGVITPPNFPSGFDPSVSFNIKGDAYFCYSTRITQNPSTHGPVYLSKTSNKGINWTHNQVNIHSYTDKPYMTIDNNPGSIYNERIYIAWKEMFDDISVRFAYSTDNGNTFHEQIIKSMSPYVYGTKAPYFPMPVVAPNGDVYVIWYGSYGGNYNASSIYIKRSTDGGNSFGLIADEPDKKVTDLTNELGANFIEKAIITSMPSIAIDHITGYLYVTYTDRISETNVNKRIKFVRSTDYGNSWSSPAILGGFTSGWQFFPMISTDKNGRTSIFFSHCADLVTKMVDTYVIESFDHGVSFSDPIRVSTQSSGPILPIGAPNYEYHGIANTANGNSYCAWTDTRNNQDIYFSKANSILYYASQNKSISPNATATNSQRKLVKDVNGGYHLVLHSGTEVLYQTSTNSGSSWSSPIVLTSEGGKNAFPSISTLGSYVFVTWQQYNGVVNNQHKYLIKGKSKNILTQDWVNMAISTPEVYFNNPTDPLPVIVAATNIDNNYNSANGLPEVMIAFRKNDGIYHVNLFYSKISYTYNQLGVIHKIPNTYGNYANPSIGKNGSGKIMLTCNSDAGSIYGWSTTGGSWITIDYSLFNKSNVVGLKNTSVTSDNTGKFHIAYEGYNTAYNTYSILHKVINSDGYPLTPVNEFTQYQYIASKPIVSGHLDSNGGVSITFNASSNIIRRINFDGINWDIAWNGLAPIKQNNANEVNAIDYMLPSTPAYCWTSTGTVPVNYNTCIGCSEQSLVSESSISTIDDKLTRKLQYSLDENFPNPFNPTTVIKYSLPDDSKVQLNIYDILGKEVAELVNEDKLAGYHQVEFNASSLASGIYFYRIHAGSFVDTKKMILMK